VDVHDVVVHGDPPYARVREDYPRGRRGVEAVTSLILR